MTQKNELEEKLIKFFNAENNRNWKVYEMFLSQDVEWISYGLPRRKVVIRKEDYVKTMIRAYQSYSRQVGPSFSARAPISIAVNLPISSSLSFLILYTHPISRIITERKKTAPLVWNMTDKL